MDGFFVLLGLALLIGLLLGPIGFFLTLGAREKLREADGRIARLEARLKRLEIAGPAAETTDVAPEPAPEPVAARAPLPGGAPDLAAPEPGIVSPPSTPDEPAETPPAAPPPLAPPPAPGRRGFEETLGTRWTVWVGGLALAIGALLLVRYSVEQGFFGPGARIFMGLALAATLVAGGEWMRRRDRGATQRGAYIPGVLTAAGAIAAFGAIFAAHAAYGFIGPGIAFVALGATGVACMFAAALHGPALAGLGLVGSLATPLIVESTDPDPWALAIYLAVVAAASHGLARLRRWLWLAVSTAIGGGLWAFALIVGIHGSNAANFFGAGAFHVLAAAALAGWFISVDPWRGVDPASAPEEPASVLVPCAFAVLAQFLLFAGASAGQFGTGWIAAAAAMTALLAWIGLSSAPAVAVTAAAGLFVAATLRVWPGTFATDIAWRLPDWSLVHWVEPVDATWYSAFAIAGALGLAAVCASRLLGPARDRFAAVCVFAGAATVTPLLALIVSWMRFGKGDTSYAFATIAAALGVVFVTAAQMFRARLVAAPADDRPEAVELGLGAFASATIAAMALAFVFALDGGTLTIALALAAAGAAWVAARLEIPALRWCVAALGLAVAARLAWEPRIVGAALGKTIVFNWLLAGYGVPALAFAAAARLMRRPDGEEDAPVQVAQALAILLAGFLVMFELRHALHDGDIYARASGFVEQGLLVFSSFGFAAVLTRLRASRRPGVFRFASLAFGVVSVAVALLGLGLGANPLFQHARIEGGALVNTLLPGYLMPAIAAYVLARLAEGSRPGWYVAGARLATIALVFAFVTLETRFVFQGADVEIGRDTSQAEWYAYSAVWLALGLALLGYGLARGSKEARLASAFFVFLTVVKVFLFDLAGLEGLWRALSFIGLGIVLLGIGLVYQKLVFTAPEPAPDAGPPVV